MRLIITFCFVFLLGFSVKAVAQQKPIPDTSKQVVKKVEQLKIDGSKVEVRKFDDQKIKEYSKEKDFIYDDVKTADTSWFNRFWRWIWWVLDKIFGGDSSRKNDGSFVKTILFILKWGLIIGVGALFIYLVIKISGLDLRLLSGKSKSIDIPYEESLENIHEINFDEQLESALQHENYRLAVRLLYLKTLKKLSDHDLILWQPEKTNQAYVLEIKDENRQQQFTKLTNQFEYIWYGEFFIDLKSYESIQKSFHQFNEQTK
ncbi:MAG: hypothetical protein EOP00_01850 [Pedobacter sp.]|nr:MAG: hypothetical protein EOP00_01850 [Pedobacter sp.]